MERPRTSSDNGSNSSKSSSVYVTFKRYYKRIFNNSEKDKEEAWKNRVIAIRPRNTTGSYIPDRRGKSGPNDQVYDTNHRYRGKVYIFNHLNFKKVASREGTMKDVENLLRALPKLGFRAKDINCFQDLSLSEIDEKLDEISKEDHTDSDMLLMFILTHGKKEGKIYAHDRDYPIQDVWEHFTADKCITLKGKPKIFFIIACRGESMDDGAVILQTRKLSLTETDAIKCQASVTYRIPIWADFLTIYSTMDGFYSYRNPSDGTWYIQSFCNELNSFSEPYMHFTDFLTKVNRNVAVTYQTMFDEPRFRNKKQCPFITSSLTKVIYLKIASNQNSTHGDDKHRPRPKSMNT